MSLFSFPQKLILRQILKWRWFIWKFRGKHQNTRRGEAEKGTNKEYVIQWAATVGALGAAQNRREGKAGSWGDISSPPALCHRLAEGLSRPSEEAPRQRHGAWPGRRNWGNQQEGQGDKCGCSQHLLPLICQAFFYFFFNWGKGGI